MSIDLFELTVNCQRVLKMLVILNIVFCPSA